MKDLPSVLCSLIRCAVFGEKSDPSLREVSMENSEELYKLSKKHDMAHLVASAFEELGINSTKFQKEKILAIYRFEQLNHETHSICQTLEKNKIPFVPLKGAFIRELYPEPWMRTSCDIDILVHEENLNRAVKAIKSELGYTAEEKCEFHDISLFSKCGVHLELHFSIKENRESIDALLSRVWEHTKKSGVYRHDFTPEFLLFYHVAHMSWHFVNGGCGVKPFIDLALLNQKLKIDQNTFISYCKECRLEKFYHSALSLSNAWFKNGEHTSTTLKMQNYILNGGVYGTQTNKIASSQAELGGKRAYLLRRVFMPYNELKIKYTNLKKFPFLLPFYEVKRWCEVFTKNKLKSTLNELKQSALMEQENVKATNLFMDELEL